MKPTPVVFEGCFGWLHPAHGLRGVVLCGPYGHEELCVHRAWKTFAETLAAAGLPTLRFDYPGSGDSAGEDSEPNRLRAWLDGVKAAARRLREDTGVTELILVGYRMGSLLATAAALELAEEGQGVDGLALLSPITSGRRAVRELQTLATMVLRPVCNPEPPERASWLNVIGMPLTPETALALGGMNPCDAPSLPARRILIADRPEAKSSLKLAARWRSMGAAVETVSISGMLEMVQQPQRARASAVFEPVLRWAADGAVAEGATPPPVRPAGLMTTTAVERPIFFGSTPELFGIYCTPVIADPAGSRPAILFLNSGATHHVGSGRATVVQARRLAARGYCSLRIDAAGIGDSPDRSGLPDNLLYNKEVMTDIRSALNWLEEQGHERIVVIGLCAGGTPTLHAGLGDDRVVGQVLLNPGRFELGAGIAVSELMRTVAHRSATEYLLEALKPARLRATLRKPARLTGLAQRLAARLFRKVLIRTGLTRHALRIFRRLSAEGRRVLVVYSSGDMTLAEFYLHLGEGGRALHGLPGIEVAYLDRSDHSLTVWEARDRLNLLIDRHLALLDCPATVGSEASGLPDWDVDLPTGERVG
ncbi:alpha/beta fold hydrolase [Azospirillum picis]|uniref:Alpha-beta hydrolase superfamily lysophospholipase n=1 Tax=Azospirillum picis TaxID=488438 RepID=A0ABU0MJP4_9PROT|nr:alpha/beta fold hydrolase [Azospirillum picis]MBP2299874.1 alpha-beta hydrolase superfamily lysophospholipase [Azospirillum picis]MDQ0533670.1 alpha-beta hydrolase superfamily lysophospholipase [Azospirillum picis]